MSAGWGCEQPGLVAAIAERVGRSRPLLIGDGNRPVVRRASAGVPALRRTLFEAIARGVDLYLSGDLRTDTVHLARESGVAYLAARHHASERYGACRRWLNISPSASGLSCEFVDIDNPV